MKSNSHAPRMFGLLVLAATLTACAQPRVQESVADEAVTAEGVSLLTDQVASLRRYSAQMEEIYASQEAEILSLQRYGARMEEIYAAQEAEIESLRREIARRGPSQSKRLFERRSTTHAAHTLSIDNIFSRPSHR